MNPFKKGSAVVVTTEFRGIFFGYLHADVDSLPKTLTLEKARNCLYWDSATRGFIGLSANGPSEGCKVGPAAEALKLNKITSIALCSKESVQAWESEPWN